MGPFGFVYYLLLLIVYILAIPYLIFKSKKEKYKVSIPAKFFLKRNPKFQNEGIWFHSCSLGETKALSSITSRLKNKVINISVMTNTGYEEAKKITNNVRYLPFEIFIPFWITKQKVLLVMEAELWYLLFLFARKKGAKTVLINARISDKSYKSYEKFSFLYKRIFQNIDKVYAQTQKDKERLEVLGARNIYVTGNIKLSQMPKIENIFKNLNENVITAASTHKNEEELILKAYKKEFGKLIIVPRHPERFDSVYEIIKDYSKKNSLTFSRFSKDSSFNSDIILIDKMGLLNEIYAISDLVVLGGAFEDNIGGHNPIEPAYFNCKLISGKKIFNQYELFECVDDYYLIDNNQLKEKFEEQDKLKKSKITKVGDIEPILKDINEWI